jgi:hypothetical protein
LLKLRLLLPLRFFFSSNLVIVDFPFLKDVVGPLFSLLDLFIGTLLLCFQPFDPVFERPSLIRRILLF